MNAFFDDVARACMRAAQSRGVDIDPPKLDGDVAGELLELARVAAHTGERRFAPLTCYLAGLTAERMRSGGAGEGEIATLIAEVRADLETRGASAPPGG